MKEIAEYCDWIEEEIADAEKYAKKALMLKDSRPDDAKEAYQTSLEEMNHMRRWHNAVVRLIDEYRVEHGEPPAPMLAIYEREHKKHIDNAAIVRSLQSLFIEG